MRMIDRRTGRLTMVLENQDVAETLVILQIEHAVAVSPKHVFHRALRERRQRRRMVRRLDDHFMRADTIHLVKQPFAFAVQLTLDAERREFIRDHANAPAWRVGPAAIAAVHENLRWRSE